MKLGRLYQPRNPAFWLMVVFNALSTLLAWVARTYELAPAASLVLAGVAIANALIGLRLMLLLMRDRPAGEPE
ncbi:MAG: hypothetical protein Q8L44_10525 [Sulfuritalea sp.]|jgi:hypothetical protein|nr:hypothetical protein [Sulfuritalea sp.]